MSILLLPPNLFTTAMSNIQEEEMLLEPTMTIKYVIVTPRIIIINLFRNVLKTSVYVV